MSTSTAQRARHVADQMLALAEHVTGGAGFERTPDVRHLVEKEDAVVDRSLEAVRVASLPRCYSRFLRR